MSEFTLTIDGKSVAGEGSLPVINPATGEAFASCPACSRSQLDDAMQAAQRAYRGWRRDEAARRRALVECADVLDAEAQAIGELVTREQGKPLEKGVAEGKGAGFWFRATAGLEIQRETLKETDDEKVELLRKPLGVVGAITPWNYPIILAAWKIAPALLAGNTLVLKPSPFTPLSSLKLGEVLRDVLPPGVLNVVGGGDELGAWICDHPAVRKISFTGSVATGKKIAAAAAPDLKRVTLELGGNDPAIVLRDADPAAIAEKLFWGAFTNSGQICVAVKRIYVEEPIHDALVQELAGWARRTRMGDGMDPETQLGPINNRPQFERVIELAEAARADGATFVTGGEPAKEGGYFFPSTIVTGLEDGSRLVDEEQFGPLLPVVLVRSAEEALERANRTHFGLGGSVWTGDVERGVALAEELECGTAWVNRHGDLSPFAPFGGFKWSGIGRENGPWGLSAFTELQVVSTDKH